MRGTEFIENTRYGREPVITDEINGASPPEIEDLPAGDLIRLPDPDRDSVRELDLSAAIELRESIRDYSTEPITLAELSYLLWCSAGVKWAFPGGAFRTVPSAGCRHAIDTYLAINYVKGVKPGLYRYIAMEHVLEVLPMYPDLQEELQASCFDQPWVNSAAVVFIWAADAYRMTWKYAERGYRNLFLDAGHICQNLYLSVQAVECGCCAIGAFKDDDLNQILNLDGSNRFVLYLATVGKMKRIEE